MTPTPAPDHPKLTKSRSLKNLEGEGLPLPCRLTGAFGLRVAIGPARARTRVRNPYSVAADVGLVVVVGRYTAGCGRYRTGPVVGSMVNAAKLWTLSWLGARELVYHSGT